MAKSLKSSQTPSRLPCKLAVYMLQIMPRALGMDDEPMFEITEENIAKIEYLCDIPFTSFSGEEKYRTLSEKAAALFYGTIKDHLFPNGNKRTAVILTCAFLVFNKKFILISQESLYDLALCIAKATKNSSPKEFEKLVSLFNIYIDDIED